MKYEITLLDEDNDFKCCICRSKASHQVMKNGGFYSFSLYFCKDHILKMVSVIGNENV